MVALIKALRHRHEMMAVGICRMRTSKITEDAAHISAPANSRYEDEFCILAHLAFPKFTFQVTTILLDQYWKKTGGKKDPPPFPPAWWSIWSQHWICHDKLGIPLMCNANYTKPPCCPKRFALPSLEYRCRWHTRRTATSRDICTIEMIHA